MRSVTTVLLLCVCTERLYEIKANLDFIVGLPLSGYDGWKQCHPIPITDHGLYFKPSRPVYSVASHIYSQQHCILNIKLRTNLCVVLIGFIKTPSNCWGTKPYFTDKLSPSLSLSLWQTPRSCLWVAPHSSCTLWIRTWLRLSCFSFVTFWRDLATYQTLLAPNFQKATNDDGVHSSFAKSVRVSLLVLFRCVQTVIVWMCGTGTKMSLAVVVGVKWTA